MVKQCKQKCDFSKKAPIRAYIPKVKVAEDNSDGKTISEAWE